MTYIVLSRRYRPQTFDEVLGQEHVSTALKNAVSSGRVAHAYIFAGPRGIGKTSTARILAKALNCKNGPTPDPCGKCETCVGISTGDDVDVVEIDGASNRGIDNVRDIRNDVAYVPLHSAYKIYYIDEAHQITHDAFNALLKTLEEPPPHVKFIFATTEPHKMPLTIQSRCQRFDFRLVPAGLIVERLTSLCKQERIRASEAALRLIAALAEGSVRDAESLLDQLTALCDDEITVDDILKVTGRASTRTLLDTVDLLKARDAKGSLELLDQLLTQGIDPGEFLNQLLGHVRDLLVLLSCGPETKLLPHEKSHLERLKAQAQGLAENSLIYMIQVLGEARKNLKANLPDRVVLEAAMIKIAHMEDLLPIEDLLAQASRLLGEKREPAADTEIRESSPPWPAPPEVEPGVAPARPAQARESWERVLAMVSEKRKTVGAFLREATVSSLGSGKIVLSFEPEHTFHKSRIEQPENKKLVEECLENVLGQHYELRLVFSDKKGAGGDRPPTAGEGSGGASETPQDDAARRVADIFQGRIVREKR